MIPAMALIPIDGKVLKAPAKWLLFSASCQGFSYDMIAGLCCKTIVEIHIGLLGEHSICRANVSEEG